MENELQREPATPEEIWAILREVSKEQRKLSRQQKQTGRQMKQTDRQMKQTDRQMKQTDRRIDKRMKKLEGLFTGQWGKLMESLVEGDLVPLLQARGISVQSTHPGCAAGVMASIMSSTSWPGTARRWWSLR